MATAHGCIDCEKYKPRIGVKCCDPHYYEIPTERLSAVHNPSVEKPPVENLPAFKPSIEKPSAEKSHAYKPLVDNPPAYKTPFEPPFYKPSIKKPQV
jgi:hypothetical protein